MKKKKQEKKNVPLALLWVLLALLFYSSVFLPQPRALIEATGLFSQEAPDWLCAVYPCDETRLMPYPLEFMLLLLLLPLIQFVAVASFLLFVLFILLLIANNVFPSLKLKPALDFLSGFFSKGTNVLNVLVPWALFVRAAAIITVPLIIFAGALALLAGVQLYAGPPSGMGGLFYLTHAGIFFALAAEALGIRLG